MSNSQEPLDKTFKSARSVRGSQRPRGAKDCPRKQKGVNSSLHSRIKEITPQLLRILKKQSPL